jgi:hypothetical protein
MTKQLNQSQEIKTNSSLTRLSKTIAAWLLALTLTMWAKWTQAQTANQDSLQQKKEQTIPKPWSFCIDPTYDFGNKDWTARITGKGNIHGIKWWWFLDLYTSPEQPLDAQSAFWRFTLSKPTDNIIKWTSIALEYMLNTATADKVRWWIIYASKLGNGYTWAKLYPVSEQWFEPYVVLFTDQKIGKKIYCSSFLNNDIANKKYYGETEGTYKITSHIDALLQARYGGKYGEKLKPQWYGGMRINF